MKWYYWLIIAVLVIVIVGYLSNWFGLGKSKKQILVEKVLKMCKENPNCDADPSNIANMDETTLQLILDGKIH